MKTCSVCSASLPFEAFYKHPKMADGYLGKCKECHKTHIRKVRTERSDYYKQYDRDRANNPDRVEARKEYAKTEAGIAAITKGRKKYIANNPDKRTAHHAVNNAVRDGRLAKSPCEVCGSTHRIHGHHDDYSKPLEVRWLCPTHHADIHKKYPDMPK